MDTILTSITKFHDGKKSINAKLILATPISPSHVHKEYFDYIEQKNVNYNRDMTQEWTLLLFAKEDGQIIPIINGYNKNIFPCVGQMFKIKIANDWNKVVNKKMMEE